MLAVSVGIVLLAFGLLMRRVVVSAFHPAAAFPLTWGLVLLLIGLAESRGFFPLAPSSLALYTFGAILFTGFSLAADNVARRLAPRTRPVVPGIDTRKLALCCLAAHLVMVPLWWTAIIGLAEGATELTAIAFQIRVKAVEENVSSGALIDNYLILGLIVTPVLLIGAIHRQLPAWLFAMTIVPWLGMNLISNGRASLMQLVLALAFVHHLSGARISTSVLVKGAGIFLLVVAGGDYLVGKTQAGSDAAIGELIGAFVDTTAAYALQGPALFSRYFEGLATVTPRWDALSFFCSVAAKVDLCMPPASIHVEFNSYGYGDWIGNVYSLYFSLYPRYGWIGTTLLLAVYAAWVTFHYRQARAGKLVHVVLAAYLFSAIPLSVFSDLFGPSLNFLIKVVIVCVALQHVFPTAPRGGRTHRRRQRTEREVSPAPVHSGA